MGWVRCTYRNCTVKSDQKTHMFHFPVFDKVRCHQWLVNAKRLDMLNLTVSQLKNRCICQHHFEDHTFMNAMKDKLKQYAVPTLDGPHCTPSTEPENENEIHFNISADLIDNDAPTFLYDKSAIFATKYGNFLTNCDIMDMAKKTADVPTKKTISDKLSTDIKKVLNPRIKKEIKEENVVNELEKSGSLEQKPKISNTKKEYFVKSVQSQGKQTQLKYVVKPLANVSPENKLKPQIYLNKSMTPSGNKSNIKILSVQTLNPPIHIDNASLLKLNEVKLNSNKSTLNISGSDEPHFDKLKQAMASSNILVEEEKKEVINEENSNILVDCEKITQVPTNPPIQSSPIKRKADYLELNLPKKKLMRSSADVAKIEEKRKFNMKLGDIIKNSINQLSKENLSEAIELFKANDEAKKLKSPAKSPASTEVAPSHQFVITYLEAKMKKMESLILNRIDNNTQKINELKNEFLSTRESKRNSDDDTSQTTKAGSSTKKAGQAVPKNVEKHKESLYKEISQFLSPEAKSIVYEQLFLNKPRHSKRVRNKISS